jgi:SAM-dependent methyltransferase
MKARSVVLSLIMIALALIATFAASAAEEESRTPDVVYVPTPHDVVTKMLDTAGVTGKDVVYDLGCGDGRIVVTAAKKYGCKAFGYDLDADRVKESKANAKKAGVESLATFEQKDVFLLDLRPASVVTLYLLPALNVKLIPQLEKLKPGSRIISHDFDMRGVTPEKMIHVRSKEDNVEHTIYFWRTPLKKESP